MRERESYPAGVPCWVDTNQPDPGAAAELYGGLFGWEFEDVMPAGSPGSYLIGRLDGRDVAAVGSQDEGETTPPAWNTYMAVESADEAATRASAAGGTTLQAPFDVQDIGRMAVLGDPSGAPFCVWEAKEFHGAQAVNEPGSWVFSELNTPDADGAAAFYGDVLGWELTSFGGGFTVFRLPGYGDHLAKGDPELRERQSSEGAPEGFEDAVAWLAPGGNGEAPPHWSVTFSVDDADAAAARAAELGGQVVVPPFDAPYVRMTVLTDPQGATFTVSKYVPQG
jgi:uncharacterized protein